MVIYVRLGSTYFTVVFICLPLIYHLLLTDNIQSSDRTQLKTTGTINRALHKLQDQKNNTKTRIKNKA